MNDTWNQNIPQVQPFNGKVCCWVLSGMSTSSDFDINTVHHDDTNDAAEDHIVENIVRQPINVGQWVLVTYENNQFPGEILSTSATHAVVKYMEKFGDFSAGQELTISCHTRSRTSQRPYNHPNHVQCRWKLFICWTTPLKLLCYICRISNYDTRFTYLQR